MLGCGGKGVCGEGGDGFLLRGGRDGWSWDEING